MSDHPGFSGAVPLEVFLGLCRHSWGDGTWEGGHGGAGL